jgi:hypothetical protein
MKQKKEYIKRLLDMVEDGIVSEKDILKYFPEAAYNAEWSEEDEEMCYKVTAVINKLCAEGKEYVWSVNTLNKLFYWLKSLKDRIQPIKDTDKNEHIPKFLVDDWVVQDGIGTFKVVEICESWYEVVSKDGVRLSIGFSQESKCRLWDIKKDAVTGDCIVDKDGNIGFFGNMSGEYYWHSLIYINDDGELFYNEIMGGGMHECFMSQPATKEERNKLFHAMNKKWQRIVDSME